MRLGDTVIGAIVALLGALLTAGAWPLPNLPNQAYGAATFPLVIGFALMALGAVMAVKGLLAGGGLAVALEGWGRSPLSWLRLVATLGLVVLYILFAWDLGFLVAGTVLLLSLLIVFRAPILPALAIAPFATFVIAWGFGNMLRVPLPRGVLSGLW